MYLLVVKSKNSKKMFPFCVNELRNDSFDIFWLLFFLDNPFLSHSLDLAGGKLEKLKVEQCKSYLRNNGLRLSGTKDVLIQRIKEHLE